MNYEKAIRLGPDFVEFDIRASRDGVPFLLHDARFDRTTNARGPSRGLDAAEIARLDAGAWFGRGFAGTAVPTLDDFPNAVGGRVELYVEARDIAPETLRARDLIDPAVVYQNPDYLARLRAIEPRPRRVPPLSDFTHADSLSLTKDGDLLVGSRTQAPASFDPNLKLLEPLDGDSRRFVTRALPPSS